MNLIEKPAPSVKHVPTSPSTQGLSCGISNVRGWGMRSISMSEGMTWNSRVRNPEAIYRPCSRNWALSVNVDPCGITDSGPQPTPFLYPRTRSPKGQSLKPSRLQSQSRCCPSSNSLHAVSVRVIVARNVWQRAVFRHLNSTSLGAQILMISTGSYTAT